MSVLFVANPSSGSAEDELLDRLGKELTALGGVTRFIASSAEAFERELIAAAPPHDIVAIAGGDGTLSLSVNALRDHLDEVTFALIPLGTGNDLARTLDLGDDPQDVARRLAHGEVTHLDVGRARSETMERLFVNACVGGFSVAVDEAVSDREKKRIGPLAFWLGGVRAARDVTRYRVEMNGREVADVVAAGIGNGRTVGGGLPLWPDASPNDGLLNGCVVAAPSLPAGVRAAAKIKAGRHEDDQAITMVEARRVVVVAEPEMELNVDGELVGLRSPATFEVAGSFRLLVPPPPT